MKKILRCLNSRYTSGGGIRLGRGLRRGLLKVIRRMRILKRGFWFRSRTNSEATLAVFDSSPSKRMQPPRKRRKVPLS